MIDIAHDDNAEPKASAELKAQNTGEVLPRSSSTSTTLHMGACVDTDGTMLDPLMESQQQRLPREGPHGDQRIILDNSSASEDPLWENDPWSAYRTFRAYHENCMRVDLLK